MTKKLINLVILVPVAIILIVLSIANRQSVALALNPFDPSDEVMSFHAPFFVYLFLALILGTILGAAITWFGQGKHRKRARLEAQEAARWQTEARQHQRRAEDLAKQALMPISSSN